MTNSGSKNNSPIDFLARFTASDQFNDVFGEGMGLVEETANYLDGPGRIDARLLDRQGSIAYATESMRLTTRLMQLASWLLLQRAISSGELTLDAAEEEKKRINLSEIGSVNTIAENDKMPETLQSLVKRSLDVHRRIMTLDQMIRDNSQADKSGSNPVNDHMDRLAAAFGDRRA